MKKKLLAIIPARGGSKRVKKKNIKLFYGKPIIYYAIQILKKSKIFDKIVVSTDSREIAEVSKKYGADVPFLRPKNISDGKTTTNPVIKHTIKFFEKKNIYFDKICCLYPTSILTRPEDLRLANKKLKKNISYIFSATRYDHPIYRSFKITKKRVELFNKKYEFSRTQDLPVFYHDAAQFYIGWRKSWLNKKSVFRKYSSFIEIPKLRSQDVDNLQDWKNLELLWKIIKK